MVSPADTKKLKTYDEKNGLPKGVRHLVEDKARTTFENAVYTKKIILEQQFDSVILVTSFYHMPRSYFLLCMVLAGSNVRVQTCGVDVSGANLKSMMKTAKGKRLLFNEMAKFWVSNLELLSYAVWRKLPEQNIRESWVIKWLRPVVLFGV